jgi:hypothetical protein
MARKQAKALGTTKQKSKFTWGGPRANSGGPRTPGPGKSLGRPKKFSEVMVRKDVRVPPAWVAVISAHGGGDFAVGMRRIVQASGVVDAGVV